jgi:hypothetical protein
MTNAAMTKPTISITASRRAGRDSELRRGFTI